MRYAKKRSYVWSSNLAYSVGLIASDGCLQKDNRHIDLTSVDIEQLTNFCKAIGRDIAITNKFNKVGGAAFRVQFSDVAYYDFLREAGLTPIKSKTMSALNIPEELYADFLRGLFDGDGTTYGYMDSRWKSSFMFYVGFTSASLPFLDYIRALNTKLIGVSPGSLRTGKRSYNLYYAKSDSRIIEAFMYYADEVLCLTRKKVKLNGFTHRDQADIILR